jgi:uncharacterized Zn-finger protein
MPFGNLGFPFQPKQLGLSPFKCSYCEKTFTQKGHVLRHERIHTGEKPYKCDTCGKAFNQSGSLKAHQIVHIKSSMWSNIWKDGTDRSHNDKH